MYSFQDIELQDCPICHGPGVLEEENGWCFYVECADCGAHTAFSSYSKEEQRLEAAQKAARIWNLGKVVTSCPND